MLPFVPIQDRRYNYPEKVDQNIRRQNQRPLNWAQVHLLNRFPSAKVRHYFGKP
jgi:hypothetical protein